MAHFRITARYIVNVTNIMIITAGLHNKHKLIALYYIQSSKNIGLFQLYRYEGRSAIAKAVNS